MGGNPFKQAEKAVKTATKQVSAESERVGETLTKAGTAALATAADPGAWLAYAVNPTGGGYMAASSAEQTYEALGTAEKEKFKAEAEARMAADTEKKAMAEQEKMVANKAKAAADVAKERAARLGQGRRGLLYQPSGEQGVQKSTVLGG